MVDEILIQENTLQLIEEKKMSFNSFEAFRKFIIKKINAWINDDFEHLLNLLYRIDVHEEKIRQLLKTHPEENAAEIIADLIIERQRQKIITKKMFKFNFPSNISEDEKW